MTISAFAGTVAAGTISGAIVAYLPVLHPRDRPNGATVTVSGHHNRAVVDQSHHDHRVLVDNRTSNQIVTTHRPKSSETDLQFILVGIGLFLGLLTFLFLWQFALGAILGASLVAGVVYIRLAKRPDLVDQIDHRAVIAQVAVSWLATIAAVAFTFLTADGGRGLPGLESRIDRRFPGYSHSVSVRWNVVTHHAGGVFSLLGARGSVELLYQMLGLFFGALITIAIVLRCLGADAALRQVTGRRLGIVRTWFLRWAPRRSHRHDLALTAMFGTIAILTSSGAATALLFG